MSEIKKHAASTKPADADKKFRNGVMHYVSKKAAQRALKVRVANYRDYDTKEHMIARMSKWIAKIVTDEPICDTKDALNDLMTEIESDDILVSDHSEEPAAEEEVIEEEDDSDDDDSDYTDVLHELSSEEEEVIEPPVVTRSVKIVTDPKNEEERKILKNNGFIVDVGGGTSTVRTYFANRQVFNEWFNAQKFE